SCSSRTRTAPAARCRAPRPPARAHRRCGSSSPAALAGREPPAQRLRHLVELVLHGPADRELRHERLRAPLELDPHPGLRPALGERHRAAQLAPHAPVAHLLEAHVAARLEVEVEGRNALAAERRVVALDRPAPPLARDDLRARIREQLRQRRVVREQARRLGPRPVDVELLLQSHAASSRPATSVDLPQWISIQAGGTRTAPPCPAASTTASSHAAARPRAARHVPAPQGTEAAATCATRSCNASAICSASGLGGG